MGAFGNHMRGKYFLRRGELDSAQRNTRGMLQSQGGIWAYSGDKNN